MHLDADSVKAPARGGETDAHKRLKGLAFKWAREQGLLITAAEVSFPHRRYRVDVAAFKPRHKVPPLKPPEALGVTAIFECKQVRSDLVKDNARRIATAAKLVKLFGRKAKLEELLSVHLPHLAKGETLFPEFDCYNFGHLEHEGYSKLLRDKRMLPLYLTFRLIP